MKLIGFVLLCFLLGAARAEAKAKGGGLPLEPGLHANVRISSYPALAKAGEVLPRLLTPLAAEAARRRLLASGHQLRPEFFSIADESFLLYVPPHQPPSGYRLLVFVPPWPKAQLPEAWRSALDRYGILFISPDRAGNGAEILERRIPLALAALASVEQSFKVDEEALWIGGFSGGSRVAVRIGLAYPDLFIGALLNAGSDPIADRGLPLPAPELMALFRNRTRLVYATGDRDQDSADLDSASLVSMRRWCVSNTSSLSDRGRGHELASAPIFARAIELLSAQPAVGPQRQRTCERERGAEVERTMRSIEQALQQGDSLGARRLLIDADAKLGGLAGGRLIQLADRCRCGLLDPKIAPTALIKDHSGPEMTDKFSPAKFFPPASDAQHWGMRSL